MTLTRSRTGQQDDNAQTPSPPSASPLQDAPSQGGIEPSSTGPTPTDIMSLISSDVNALSEEGKVIVSSIVKAMQIIINNKDETLAQLQSHIVLLENSLTTRESNR